MPACSLLAAASFSRGPDYHRHMREGVAAGSDGTRTCFDILIGAYVDLAVLRKLVIEFESFELD